MSTRTSRGPSRRRSATLLSSTIAHHVEASPQSVANEDGLDAGAPHPIFADAARRQTLIAEAAYFLAERRGFEPGHELEDWCAAERDIDGRLFRGDLSIR